MLNRIIPDATPLISAAPIVKSQFAILIVDDKKENLVALNALLEREDVIIYQALSGTLALELMMKHDFCLAFLDVNMPGMNGFELAEFMRGSNRTKRIPIIFVTATAKEQSFLFKGYESGAVDFLLKPLDPFAVSSKVNVFIELFQQKLELRLAEEKFRGLLETAPDAIVIVNETGRIEIVNKKTETIFGYDRSDMIGQTIEMLMPEKFHNSHHGHLRNYTADPTSRNMGQGLDLLGRRKDGTEFPIDISLSPLKTENGILMSNAIRDITARRASEKQQQELLEKFKKIQTDLQKAVLVADNANNFKTQFLANMSHEIRTPLGAILGFIDLLKNPDCPAQEKTDYMVIVERNSKQLLSLIDDILDLSKVESGKMTIEKLSFSFAEMLADFTSHMRFRAEEKGINFDFKVTTLIPDIICSDPVRLRQILGNIIGNAIKFTDKGSVELSIAYTNPTLTFTVKDTGVGISPEQSLKLFQPFTQANASTTRKFGGTGLGLILSRRLAEALDGTLILSESHESRGTTFQITVQSALIPEAQLVGIEKLGEISAPVPVKVRTGSQILSGLRILLVEDSPDNQKLFCLYLTHEGAQVEIASNGAEGVALALAGNFDVILMDIQMPVLDGHEATKKLRRLNYLKPITALTAHAMKEERIKCIDSGFTDFLTKPLQKVLLIEAMAKYVPKPFASLA